MLVLALGLVIFIGVHLVPATPVRARLAAHLGNGGYRGLHAALALAGLVLVVIGFGQARAAGPDLLYMPPFWLRHLALALMLVATVLAMASLLPCHIARWVRHPLVSAVAVWAFAHLLANGDAASVLLFGSFFLWAGFTRISLKRREVAGLVVVRSGPWRNDFLVLVAGLLVYAVILFRLHVLLIGVPVVL